MSWAPVLSLIGPTGPFGLTGYTGPAGSAVYHQGLWVESTSYNVNDIALSSLDGNSYICITSDSPSSDDPSINANWEIYLNSGPTGATGPAGAGNTGPSGPAGSIGSQIYGLGFSPQGNLDGVTGPVGATGPTNATVLDYVFDLKNGLIWQPKRWAVNPSDDFSVAGTTGDYVVNTQVAGVTGSSALLSPVLSITYDVSADSGSGNHLVGNTGFAIIGWNSDMSAQGSTGTLYVNGSQAGLSGTTGPFLNDGTYGNTGSVVFDLSGTPWVDGSNILVFEPSNPVSLVPDVFLTMEHTNFHMPPV